MKLYYRKYGSGPPLIILHGLYGSSDNWSSIARRISNIYTVYLPDQRNHGFSPHSNVHDYNSMTEDLFELTNELKINKFILAGHSMGGKTAMNFALRWPEKLNGLLIADVSPFKAEKNYEKFKNQHIKILETVKSIDLSRITSRIQVERFLTETILSEKIKGLIMKNLKRNHDNTFSWKININSLLRNIEEIMAGIIEKTSNNEPVKGFPVVFLKGVNSDYIPDGDLTEILKIFPAAEFFKVPDAGHWLNAERPDVIEKYLRSFINNY